METAAESDAGHGRVEERRLDCTERLKAYLDCPGAKQVCRVRRRRIAGKTTSEETAYAITSLARNRAGAAELLKLWRGHWGIENRLHWVRDVTLGEDACRVRSAGGAQFLAAVRNTVVTLLRWSGFTNVAEGIEHFQENRLRALSLIFNRRIE